MNITPTIGSKVLYKPEAMQEETHAAIVAKVNQDGTVNLGCFTQHGGLYGRENVRIVQDGEDTPTSGGYAHWMPYQVGQAAKTEQVQQVSNAALDEIDKRLAAMQERVNFLNEQIEILVEMPSAPRANYLDGAQGEGTQSEGIGGPGAQVPAPEAA